MQPKKIEKVEISKLEFDPENPRLPPTVGRKQEEMRDYLAHGTGMQELMASIGANGFFEAEVLVVCETSKTKSDGIYRVVEGNRRLAALQLLQNPSLVDRKSIKNIAKAAQILPASVPVAIFGKRKDILVYLGFRHITGVKNWKALEKARYMAQLFDHKTNEKAKPDDRYREVAKMIGSRANYVRKTLIGFRLYLDIEANEFYDIEDLQEGDFPQAFFNTAVSYENIAKFLDVKGEPVSAGRGKLKANKDRVRELVEWLFKPDAKGKTKVGESRDLKKLAAVVADRKALNAFREGATLEQAHQGTYGEVLEFTEHLYKAEAHLGQANSIVSAVSDRLEDEHRGLADRIAKQASGLQKMMKD